MSDAQRALEGLRRELGRELTPRERLVVVQVMAQCSDADRMKLDALATRVEEACARHFLAAREVCAAEGGAGERLEAALRAFAAARADYGSALHEAALAGLDVLELVDELPALAERTEDDG